MRWSQVLRRTRLWRDNTQLLQHHPLHFHPLFAVREYVSSDSHRHVPGLVQLSRNNCWDVTTPELQVSLQPATEPFQQKWQVLGQGCVCVTLYRLKDTVSKLEMVGSSGVSQYNSVLI